VPADCSVPADIAGSIAIAGVPSLAGTTLATDNQMLMIDRSHDLDLTWQVAAAGRTDYWVVTLFAVVAQGGATVPVPKRRWYVTDTHVALDPALLAPGTPYFVQVTAFEGFPDVGAGDLRTSGFPGAPYATSQQPSAIFQVSN